MRGVYVYAFTDRRLPPVRLGRRTIRVVPCAGVHAAIEYRRKPPSASEASLRLQHAIVMQLAASAGAILPARFGAWLTLDELERTIARRRSAIRRALKDVSGREQMTIRFFSDAPPRLDSPRPMSGTAYLLSRQQGIDKALRPVIRSVRTALKPLIADERVHPGRGTVAAILDHLIVRGSAARYRALAAAALASSPAIARISGPWPPFAFVPELLE